MSIYNRYRIDRNVAIAQAKAGVTIASSYGFFHTGFILLGAGGLLGPAAVLLGAISVIGGIVIIASALDAYHDDFFDALLGDDSQLLPSSGNDSSSSSTAPYVNFAGWTSAPLCHDDPLILDLDGDGVEAGGVALFDHEGDGFAELSRWVGEDDGLLVWDRNGDGVINDGSELFGNNTVLANGDKASHGFAALAELDSNDDGVVGADDDNFAALQILRWTDTDGDGEKDTMELVSLADAGVQSLNTGFVNSDYVDEDGNEHRQVGSYVKTDGTTATMTDVWFDSNRRASVYDGADIPAHSEAVAGMPEVIGSGRVYDLRDAMALDEAGLLGAPFYSDRHIELRQEWERLGRRVVVSVERAVCFCGQVGRKKVGLGLTTAVNRLEWAASFGANTVERHRLRPLRSRVREASGMSSVLACRLSERTRRPGLTGNGGPPGEGGCRESAVRLPRKARSGGGAMVFAPISGAFRAWNWRGGDGVRLDDCVRLRRISGGGSVGGEIGGGYWRAATNSADDVDCGSVEGILGAMPGCAGVGGEKNLRLGGGSPGEMGAPGGSGISALSSVGMGRVWSWADLAGGEKFANRGWGVSGAAFGRGLLSPRRGRCVMGVILACRFLIAAAGCRESRRMRVRLFVLPSGLSFGAGNQ